MQKWLLQIFQELKLQIWMERLESRDRFWLFGAWTLWHRDSVYSLCSPPSYSFLHTLMELQWKKTFLLGKHQWSLFLYTQGISWTAHGYSPPCFEGVAWTSLLKFSLVLHWGNGERDFCSSGSHWDECVHITDLRKTGIYQINVMLSKY